MARATTNTGQLQELVKCRIITPFLDTDGNPAVIRLKVLPEISDSKAANYYNETIPGRTAPVPTYSHSEVRTINSELKFITTCCNDIYDNISYLRMIQSLVYPGDATAGAPFTPPPVCKFICGQLLGATGVCVVLKSYSNKFPTNTAWDTTTYLPYEFSVSCSWEVVYACRDLPTNDMIYKINGTWPAPIDAWNCPPAQTDIA